MPKSERNIISAQMEDILNAMPDGVFISDVDGTTLFVNRIYEQLTGFTLGELRGRQVRDIVAEGGFDLILNPEIVREGKPVSRVQTLRNGKKLMLSGIPVFDKNGSISLVRTFARDITMLDAMRDKLDEQHRQIRQIQASYTQIEEEQQRSAQPIIESSAMHGVMRFISQVAATDATLLLLGETGVGKDVFARHAHNISPRKDGPFLKIDCGGISESLIEAEMFGYEPGSFTGASQKGKAGYFEQARGGTVFLDEVGELSMPMQTRLLRVLQDGEFVRVGGTRACRTDVRVIAATNRDLAECAEKGTFRRDLFYRLNVASVVVPPLRERADAIRPMAMAFLERYCARYHKRLTFMPSALDSLERYNWPGNVRELQNVVHTLVITAKGTQISPRDLPSSIPGEESSLPFANEDFNGGRPLREIMADVERDFLIRAIKYHGSVPKVSKLFMLNRSTIFRKIRKRDS